MGRHTYPITKIYNYATTLRQILIKRMSDTARYIKITRKRGFSLPQNVQRGSGFHPAFFPLVPEFCAGNKAART